MSQEERVTYFADVIIPIPVPGLFTYRIPHEMRHQAFPGQRVIVQFGKKKVYAGLIRRIHGQAPSQYAAKYILGILDEQPILDEKHLLFWDWLHHYYMSFPGEVMVSALPGALKLSSESKIVLNTAFSFDVQTLSDNEFLITEALGIQPQLSLSEVSSIVGFQKVMPLIKTMIEKQIIVMEEELHEKFKVKTEKVAWLHESFKDEGKLKQLMDQLTKKAFKQLEIVMVYLRETRFPIGEAGKIPVKKLLDASGSAAAQFKSLVEKNVFVTEEQVISRLEQYVASRDISSIHLTSVQQKALEEIKRQFSEKEVVLLHGVTSSGKTELYMKLIDDCLQKGEQVLYLLPEIALTTQIIERLKTIFGPKAGVYHSKYNPNEKVEIWNKVLAFKANESTDHQVIIGPRSALFLPFRNLGLIIVDEEHDQSFKQQEPAPRYQARDAAIVLAGMHQAKVLLGSATPSFESYYNASTGKYGLVVLKERFGGMQMPDISIVNMREEKRRKTAQSHFSSVLINEIRQTIALKEQTILFQNRRGFSLRLECDQCNWYPECRNCDVSLVYHKKQNMLRCHYCGYSIAVPSHCPSCHSTAIKMHGFGTEKVEEELSLIFPELHIARLDLDTTRSKYAFQEIIEGFSAGKTQVMVGTQMVTKGLDFANVRVVGILNADNMLSYPDFRSFERSFQLMAQVSGRAGRKNKQGKVIIQTHQPNHQMMQYVLKNDYEGLFFHQMAERKKFNYPPFFRIIMIQLHHRDNHTVNVAAFDLAKLLKENNSFELLGPEFPVISRIKSMYIKQIIIKFPRNRNASEIKAFLHDRIDRLITTEGYTSLRIHLDVDPQ